MLIFETKKDLKSISYLKKLEKEKQNELKTIKMKERIKNRKNQ